MCSGVVPQFEHIVSICVLLCLEVLASLTFVHNVLSSICTDVHCTDGVTFLLRTLSNALEKSSGLMLVIPSLLYVIYDLGYGPHSHVSLCAISISSVATEHPDVYFLANDLMVVMLSGRAVVVRICVLNVFLIVEIIALMLFITITGTDMPNSA